ncbi:MAG: tetratricopeptide repeat protein, partial [Thermodesulfobacteriota bacterium]
MARKEKLIEKAQKFIQKGYLDKAIAEYRSAQQLDSNDVSIRLRLGDLYVKTDRKEEAIKEYTDAAKSNSQRGFYLKAIAVYKQILKLNDSDLDVHYRLADLYTKQRLNADAISEYSHIVNALELLGKVDEALVIVNKMVDIDSENTGIRLRLAEIYQKKGFDEDALAEYSNVFDKLVEDGKLDRAEKIYVHLHESYPDNVEVLERLADLFKLKGDSDRYLAYSRILMRRHEKAGDSERLRAVCEAILDENPEDEDAKRIMGEIAPSAPDKPRDKGETPAEAVEAAGDVAEEPSAEAAADVAEEAVVEVASSDAERLAGDEGGAGEAPEEIVISLDGFDEKEEASEAAWEAPSGEDPAGEIAAATSAEEAAAEEVAAGGDEDDLVDIEVPGIEEDLAGAMAEADGPEEVPEEEAGSAAAPEAADDVAADVAAEATAQEAAEDVVEGVAEETAVPEAAGDVAEEVAAEA